MFKILLACGAGCSSGFMAAAMRKAAKKKGIEVEVKSIPDRDIQNLAKDYDILLLGSHLEYKFADTQEKLKGTNTKVALIDKMDYAMIDGEAVLANALSALGQ